VLKELPFVFGMAKVTEIRIWQKKAKNFFGIFLMRLDAAHGYEKLRVQKRIWLAAVSGRST
jgi:hypothetical protein